MTREEIEGAIASVDQLLKGINDRVNQLIANPIVGLLPFAAPILSLIHDQVSNVSHTLEAVIAAIKLDITGAINAIAPGAIDFFTSVLKTLGDNIAAILGNLATAEEFVASAVGELKKHAPQAAGFLLGAIGGGLSGGLIDAFKFLEGEHRAPIDQMMDHMLDNPALPQFMKTQLHGVRERGAPWMALLLPLLVAVAVQPLAAAVLNPAIVWAAQESNKDFPLVEMGPADLVAALRKKVIAYPEFKDGMARHGFNEHRAVTMYNNSFQRLQPETLSRLSIRGLMNDATVSAEAEQYGLNLDRVRNIIEATRPLLAEDQIRQTFLRGIIDRPKHDELMKQHGYTTERIDQMVRLYYMIPGPQDLIHMAIRNVFSPEIVERFQLFGDFPPAFKQAAASQGISEEWALRYWGAHWIVPSNTEGFEMFQRTTDKSEDEHADTYTLSDGTKVQNVIGRSTLQLLLREKDTAPYYRNKLTEIAYHPLTRIDVRRMYSVGSLDHAGVERAYLDLGYSPKNALRLADFIQKYYTQAKKDKALPLLDGLRRRVLALYEQEKLELSDASFALTDLGFSKEESDYWLQEVKIIQQAEDAKEIEAGIGKLYLKDFIPESDARDRLQKALVPAAAIERLVKKWNIQREYARDTEHFHKVRDLTKGEVVTAYKDQLMTEKDAIDFLDALGYPAGEAKILIHVADFQREAATRKALQDAIKSLYVSGIRDRVATSNALDALALPALQRDALMAEWTLLRETRTERLPVATLKDMLRGKYLTRPVAFDHLKRHRYTDDDANLLLDFWQGVKPQGA